MIDKHKSCEDAIVPMKYDRDLSFQVPESIRFWTENIGTIALDRTDNLTTSREMHPLPKTRDSHIYIFSRIPK